MHQDLRLGIVGVSLLPFGANSIQHARDKSGRQSELALVTIALYLTAICVIDER